MVVGGEACVTSAKKNRSKRKIMLPFLALNIEIFVPCIAASYWHSREVVFVVHFSGRFGRCLCDLSVLCLAQCAKKNIHRRARCEKKKTSIVFACDLRAPFSLHCAALCTLKLA